MRRIVRGRLVETDDAGDQQFVKLLGPRGETLSRVHRVQPFGFHSSSPADAHGVVLQLGPNDGGRLLNLALGMEHAQHRPKNREAGSSVLYDANGNMVSVVKGEVRIVHSAKITLVAGGTTLTISGSGVAISGGQVTHDGKNIGSDHKHGGVMRGSSPTDEPIG